MIDTEMFINFDAIEETAKILGVPDLTTIGLSPKSIASLEKAKLNLRGLWGYTRGEEGYDSLLHIPGLGMGTIEEVAEKCGQLGIRSHEQNIGALVGNADKAGKNKQGYSLRAITGRFYEEVGSSLSPEVSIEDLASGTFHSMVEFTSQCSSKLRDAVKEVFEEASLAGFDNVGMVRSSKHLKIQKLLGVNRAYFLNFGLKGLEEALDYYIIGQNIKDPLIS